jgi:hypothetical protein
MHVCCGFRDGDPDQLDIAQSSQTRGLALVQTTIHYSSTTHAVNSVTCHDPGAYTRVGKATLDVLLSKAQLAEQSAFHGTTCCRTPVIKRRTYICKTTRKDMHTHVALRTLERCMDVVQLLLIRQLPFFEDSSLAAGTSP